MVVFHEYLLTKQMVAGRDLLVQSQKLKRINEREREGEGEAYSRTKETV